MKSKDDSMDWIPLWVDKWIFGSTRLELQPDERAVWVDLMALASKDNGFIRANPSTGYPITQLSGLLCIPEELLERTIQRCIETGKVKIVENVDNSANCGNLAKVFYIVNWAEYQLSPRHKRRFEENLLKMDGNIETPIFLKCPIKFDSMKMKNGSVRYSRLIIALAVNRSLSGDEEVHHINKIETDDRIENLMLFQTHKNHTQYEHGFNIRPEFDGSKLTKKEIAAIMAEYAATIGEERRGEDIKEKISFSNVDKSKPQPLKVKCDRCGKPYAIKEEHICPK